MSNYKEIYEYWLERVGRGHRELLLALTEDEIEGAFFGELNFGTGGIRAVMGMGSALLNEYTIKKIAKGTADYFLQLSGSGAAEFDSAGGSESGFSSGEVDLNLSGGFESGAVFFEGASAGHNSQESGLAPTVGRLGASEGTSPKVVISFDNRINSRLFARLTARVLAECGLTAIVAKTCMPTPYLSFMVRKMRAVGGIMITASHNPKQYNGFKLYGADGCQLLESDADRAAHFINNADPFSLTIERFSYYQRRGLIRLTAAHRAYLSAVAETLGRGARRLKRLKNEGLYKEYDYKKLSVKSALKESIDSELRIIYTPLCGTGGFLAEKLLKNEGRLFVVPRQAAPDGQFTFCPVSNPENPAAFEMALFYAREFEADLVLASDPDADRMGAFARNKQGGFEFLTGNQIGILLTDFLLSENLVAARAARGEICRDCGTALDRSFLDNSVLDSSSFDSSALNGGVFGGGTLDCETHGSEALGGGTFEGAEFDCSGKAVGGLELGCGEAAGGGLSPASFCGGEHTAGQRGRAVDCPVIVRSIVSTPMTDEIAREYGAEVVVVPTGFKYIGAVIAGLEARGQEGRFLFGFEESHGYLSGTYARDKDGLLAAALLSRYAARLKSEGSCLPDALAKLYSKYGYYLHKTVSYRFEGARGVDKIREFMRRVRGGDFLRGAGEFVFTDYNLPIDSKPSRTGGKELDALVNSAEQVESLETGGSSGSACTRGSKEFEGLNGSANSAGAAYPAGYPAEMVELTFEEGSVIVRPSGTEPLIKAYLMAKAESIDTAEKILSRFKKLCDEFFV